MLLLPPGCEKGADSHAGAHDSKEHNEGLFRLDLSGAIGTSISFKQLIELVQKPITSVDDDIVADDGMSWEDNVRISKSPSPTLAHVSHLSLSHPGSNVSWARLLAFAKHAPTLSHLSLAFWPIPSLTANATTAVVQSKDRDIQYGGTNFYSHSLDNDFREASDILRRLAGRLYGLEYLDLSGCYQWLRALRWNGNRNEDAGVDWASQWLKLHTLKVHSGMRFDEGIEYCDLVQFIHAYKQALATEEMLGWWMKKTKAGRNGMSSSQTPRQEVLPLERIFTHTYSISYYGYRLQC